MSIYTKKQLCDEVQNINDVVTLRSIVTRLIMSASAIKYQNELAGIIMNTDRAGRGMPVCELTDEKVISEKSMLELSESHAVQFIEDIIEVADQGAYQTREIMLKVAERYPDAYYMQGTKLPHQAKVHFGYILLMAGYEPKSTYMKDRTSCIKTWRKRHGFARLSNKERIETVKSIMRCSLLVINTRRKDKKKNSKKVDPLI